MVASRDARGLLDRTPLAHVVHPPSAPRTTTVSNSHVERIVMADTSATPIFTATSAFSIAGVFGALAFAYVGLVKLLPKTASRTDRVTFVWLVSSTLSLWREPSTRSFPRRSTR